MRQFKDWMPSFGHVGTLHASQPSAKPCSSSPLKPKKSVRARDQPMLSRSCTMVAVTVEGTFPKKYGAAAHTNWSTWSDQLESIKPRGDGAVAAGLTGAESDALEKAATELLFEAKRASVLAHIRERHRQRELGAERCGRPLLTIACELDALRAQHILKELGLRGVGREEDSRGAPTPG